MNEKEEVSNSLVQPAIKKLNSIKWSDAVPQIIASLCSYAIVTQAGVNLAYSAVLLPQLNAKDSDISIDSNQASWIASLVTISLPFGALALGPLMDKFGRKNICLATCFPFILSWILVATAKDVRQIYAARIFAGAGGGVCCTWRTMAIVFCIMSIISLILLFPLPESPQWLVTFSEEGALPIEDISKSLHWIYRDQKVFEEEYRQIINSRPKQPTSSFNRLHKVVSIYTQPMVYKPTLLLVILFIFQQFSGGYVIIFYAVDVFKSIGGNFGAGINEFIALILIGAIRFIMSLVSSVLAKKFGRKPLLCSSGIGMGICTLGVSLYVSFFSSYDLDFIPLVCVLGYVTFASFGFFVVPWSLIGELLPVKVRATMGGVMITWAYLCMFVIVKMFPAMLEFFGISLIFAIYSGFSFAAVCFIMWCIPETFGKTFTEIGEYFQPKNSNVYN